MTWNSTFKSPGQPLKRSPMTRRSPRRAATKQERAYMSAQADAGCILCRFLGLGNTPAEIHHLRHGVGAGQRNSNLMTIPLCPEHHQGRTGYHGLGRRAFEREYGVTEMDLWAMAQKQNPATLAGVPGLQSHSL
jgi:hypothetical protein